MVAQSSYEILGVTTDSPMTEIRKAYLREARTWHPDKRRDNTEEERAFTKAQFLAIQKAYEELQKAHETPIALQQYAGNEMHENARDKFERARECFEFSEERMSHLQVAVEGGAYNGGDEATRQKQREALKKHSKRAFRDNVLLKHQLRIAEMNLEMGEMMEERNKEQARVKAVEQEAADAQAKKEQAAGRPSVMPGGTLGDAVYECLDDAAAGVKDLINAIANPWGSWPFSSFVETPKPAFDGTPIWVSGDLLKPQVKPEAEKKEENDKKPLKLLDATVAN